MDRYIETMKKAAKAAADAIRATKGGMMWRQKDSREYVTNCDIASENAIIEVLQKEFPDSTIYSEEVGEITGEEDLLWILDPIDGTHNFIHSLPYYAVSIGAYKRGKPFAGLIYLPEFDEYLYAVEGKGAYLDDKRISVSSIEKLGNSMITYDNQFHKHEAMLKNLESLQAKCFTVRVFGSAAVDLCSVAKGAVEARVFHKTKIFDFAAGILIVKEAGGTVTDFKGKEVNPETSDVLVSNGKIHQELMDLLEL
ncbi:inositol monophosphatase family protein [Nanoarchaeota archaeon]